MENPYAAPQANLTPPAAPQTEAETIRQQHLPHEVSVQSVASLFHLGALLLTLGWLSFLGFSLTAVGSARWEVSTLILISLPLLGLIVLQLKLAGGLRNLRPWVRVPVIILSTIGLLGFPVGTIIAGYVLYLMLSEKSTMIFSPGYQQIILDTPHIRQRTSALKTVVAFLLMLAVAIGLAFYFKADP